MTSDMKTIILRLLAATAILAVGIVLGQIVDRKLNHVRDVAKMVQTKDLAPDDVAGLTGK